MMSDRLTRRSVLGAGALAALVAIDSSAARGCWNWSPPGR